LLGPGISKRHQVRRHRPGAATSAYSLALALTGDAQKAETIAIVALKKGAGSRIAVTSHARHECLSAAQSPTTGATDPIRCSDLRELAQQLALSRPPVERLIVELDARLTLDVSSSARVLGLPVDRTKERLQAVSSTWARELDPAMMAWLGPGSCPELASVLRSYAVWPRASDTPLISSVDSTGPLPVLRTGTDATLVAPEFEPEMPHAVTLEQLLTVAPAVHNHAQGCSVCSERLRLLTPVRTLIGQTPLEEVPPRVVEAARSARRRVPAPLPPSIERRRLDYKRLALPAFGVAATLVIALVGFAAYEATTGNKPSQASRVAKLVKDAPVSHLLGTPTVITPGITTADLADTGDQVVSWNASTNVPWIQLTPISGRLSPSQSVSISVVANPPPTSAGDAVITIKGDDGSVQVLRYDADGG
jgi:hypothetical protein